MQLIKYNLIQEQAYLNYILEWEATGEIIVPGASARRQLSFETLQEKWADDEINVEGCIAKGFVPSTLYFYVETSGIPELERSEESDATFGSYESNENNGYQKIIGAIHLRHFLNERLLVDGGHIGYGIRLGERGNGYAKAMLQNLIGVLEEKGYDRVLLTCNDDNVGSARTIEACGGVLENKVVFEGVLIRRYWINITH